jgi:FAD/FMN-containing dehydrogenase/Fe-S oxidoreductase
VKIKKMLVNQLIEDLNNLGLTGDIIADEINILAYSTDSSVYRERPIAIVYPKDTQDVVKLVKFAANHNVNLIPRGAGTSLAGQVVGDGVVLDVSKYLNEILEINTEEKYAVIQPGVVRDELNLELKKHGLFFAPETSTSNRCNIGGMMGNNSCGANALRYGSTREHVLSSKNVLSNGDVVDFSDMKLSEIEKLSSKSDLQAKIYSNILQIITDPDKIQTIQDASPLLDVKRRNTGYALDMLIENPFRGSAYGHTDRITDRITDRVYNLNNLLCGSEGTLAVTVEMKVALQEIPKVEKALIPVHMKDIVEAAKANIIALKHNPHSVELMDKYIMDLSLQNPTQAQNRFFIKGDPGAILMVEISGANQTEIESNANALIEDLKSKNMGYHFPIIKGDQMKKVWDLRKAGLGVLANLPGDEKAVAVVEDTAVSTNLLADYLQDAIDYFETKNLKAVYYAHISTGEIHIRPLINLKSEQGRELFHEVAEYFATLVKKYRGSLSGEHGDGRLRGEFIEKMVGADNFQLMLDIKKTFDPANIFNRNKIFNTPKMNTHLRYDKDYKSIELDTVFDFAKEGGFQNSFERCNGSGDCRKSELISGVMCPSFQGSKKEIQSTRARANVLREMFSRGSYAFESEEVKQVLDLCLSCKACKSECPSNVDITKIKAEFLNSYYSIKGLDFRTKLIAYNPKINQILSPFSKFYNSIISVSVFQKIIQKSLGFTTQRSLPKLNVFNKPEVNLNISGYEESKSKSKVLIYLDEFSKFNHGDLVDVSLKLLNKLGYDAQVSKYLNSGRTFFSKGLLNKAKECATENVNYFYEIHEKYDAIIGLEASAILSFRDEYPEIVGQSLLDKANVLQQKTFLFEEWFDAEISRGNIMQSHFTNSHKTIKFHTHCYQKALSNSDVTQRILNFPTNYKAEIIEAGCCGVAGSFGYEKEHYSLSKTVGELKLLPEVRTASKEVEIVANGTSCRHGIADGSQRKANHPAQILYRALSEDIL